MDSNDDNVAQNQNNLLTRDEEENEVDPNAINESDSTIVRGKKVLRQFLHSKPVHIAIIILVIVDCILVMAEITLDLAKDESHSEDKKNAAEILHYLSLSILSIFMIEIGLKLFADFHHFITHKIEVFDAVIVVVSFAIDVAVLFLNENEALVAFGLFVLLRLWRVVRVINGIIVSAKSNADERVHAVKAEVDQLQTKIDEMKQELEDSQQEILRLQNIIEREGIAYHQDLANMKSTM